MIEMELTVIAIHGEGDRDTVNALQDHRNDVEARQRAAFNQIVPASLVMPADEPPDVMIVLRDAAHDFRMEWPVKTWEEVEEWKAAAGWDQDKRHWKHGATVKVKIGA